MSHTWRRDNIKINRKEMGHGGVKEINVPQDKDQCKYSTEKQG
jgi:hypothetical protein